MQDLELPKLDGISAEEKPRQRDERRRGGTMRVGERVARRRGAVGEEGRDGVH